MINGTISPIDVTIWQVKMSKDLELVLTNETVGLSRYAADFDYLMHDYVLRTLSPNFKGSKAAELGSYKGEMTLKLAQLFKSVTALEIETELCAELKNRMPNNVKVTECDFTAHKEFSEFTDIFSVHSLEHINHHIDFLAHLKKYKNPESNLYIVVPNGDSLSRHIAVAMGIMERNTDITDFEKKIGHYHTFTRETLQQDIEKVGLNIVKSGGIMPKIFSNGQYDKAFSAGILSEEFFEASFKLSDRYPDICASIYFICK